MLFKWRDKREERESGRGRERGEREGEGVS